MSITTTFISLDLTGFMRNGDYEPTVRVLPCARAHTRRHPA